MSLPRMSLHIGDYRKDTGHLRAAEHGAYLLLIMHYWAKGSLPNDDRQLAAIACMTDREWKRARPIIEAFFSPHWTHGRVEDELRLAKEKYERRAAAGKEGSKARAAAKQCSSNATAKSKQPITLTNNQRGEGDAVDARATHPAKPDPLVSGEAIAIADEVAIIAGHDPQHPDPRWYGAAMHVSAWLREGWTREVIILGAKMAMAKKRDGPPFSINFFKGEIAKQVALLAEPLPLVKIADAQEITIGGANGQHRNGSFAHGAANGGGHRDLATIAVESARAASQARR